MAEQEDIGGDIAKNIVRNLIPFGVAQDIKGLYQTGEDTVMSLLRSLGLLGQTPEPPPINVPLPRKDPVTGQIIFPEGYRGPR